MKKLKAGALIYVLIITLLGSMLAGFFLLYNQLSGQTSYIYFRNYKSQRLLESGICYVMASGEILEENKEYFPIENEPLAVKRKSWGIYSLILSKVSQEHKEYTRAVLTGSGIRSDEHPALFVSDLGHPISICGNARIEGKAFVPERGFKRAYIEGQNYTGDQFVYGPKLNSKRDIPPLEETSFDKIRQYLDGKITSTDSVINYAEWLNDTIINSFFNSTLVVEIASGTKIGHGYFSGNIVLLCRGKLILGKNTVLKDCIVYARELEIESGNHSHFQAFASHAILLKENSILKYPSVLGVFPKSQIPGEELELPSVRMEKNSRMDGSLIAFTKTNERGKEVLVSVLENSVLTGEAYSSHFSEVTGTIQGSLYCQQFYLKTPSSVYQNYLLGGKIISTKLPEDFCGLQFRDQHYKKIIMDEVE